MAVSREDARRQHNKRMLAGLGPIPPGEGYLAVDWAEVARRLGLTDAAEAPQLWWDLAMNTDLWTVAVEQERKEMSPAA